MAITLKVTLKRESSFTRPSYRSAFAVDTVTVYTFADENENIFVWKTASAILKKEVPYVGKVGMHNFENRKGEPIDYIFPHVGSIILISATIKGETEYKGVKQTEITRVKVLDIIKAGKTLEQIKAEKAAAREQAKEEQLSTIKENDFIWKMPYKQYKDHYSDCETVLDSFERHNGHSYIDVIIREGRLKNSGVRGKRFYGFQLVNSKGEYVTYSAVCEENAIRHAEKDFPDEGWKVVHIW